VQEKDCEIMELRSEIADLKAMVNAIMERNGGGQ
jgi:hypothetical protein